MARFDIARRRIAERAKLGAMPPVRVEPDDGGLTVVTIDSPPLNLLDEPLREALLAAVDELERGAARAVLFRADGRVVSGGVDVRLFDALPGPAEAAAVFRELVQISQRVAALPCPTVFAAHATCLTWAFELALACDLVVAAESASFGLVEATVGLTPAMGGTQRLAERAGSGRARELVLTAERFDASTLHSWGVVNRLWPDDGFDAAARELAGRLAAGPTLAHAATKRVIEHYLRGGVAAADEHVPELAGELFATEDLRGAMRPSSGAGVAAAGWHC
jgi:enoyl-CoA hydratase/carnithine racemase